MKFHIHYLILIAVLLITLMPTASADNFLGTIDNVKSYDAVTSTVTYYDWFGLGNKIANIQLLTPHVYGVISGNDRLVAKLQWNINDMTCKDVMKAMELSVNDDRNIRYKYLEIKGYYDSPVQDTKCDKIEGKNGTEEKCYSIDIGVKKIPIENWIEFKDINELPKENITIGIFADVKPYDNVEWIPTWFGVKTPEFAVWQDSYSVGLIGYYNFEQTVGTTTLQEMTRQHINATIYGAQASNPVSVSGILGNAWNWSGTASKKVNLTYTFTGLPNGTINMWINVHSTSQAAIMGAGSNNCGGDFDVFDEESGNTLSFAIHNSGCGTGSVRLTANQDVVLDNWQMITAIFTDGGKKLYLNGTAVGTDTSILTIYGNEILIGWRGDFDGKFAIDELGLWNRTLSTTEITAIYNAGAGMTYSASSATPITFDYANLITPSDSFNTTQTSIYFASNASVTNANLTNATLYIWNGGTKTNLTTMTGDMPYNMTNISYSGLTDGNYNWSFQWCASNTTIAQCQYATTNRTLTIDTTKPKSIILYPLNQTYNINITAMNFSVSDTHLQACWYSTNSTQNATITCGNNATGLTSTEGSNTWMFGANDTFGNQNTTYVTFWKDTIAPEIELVYPENATYDFNDIGLNYTVSDSNLESCWYSWNDGSDNQSMVCNINVSGLIASEGSNIWNVWANDTSGNVNSSTVNFDVDTIPPIVNILYPANASYNVNVDEVNYSITHLTGTLDSCMYSRTGTGNFTPVDAGINFTAVATTEGSNQIIISCNDTANNWGYADVTFFRDTVAPEINIVYPSNSTYNYNITELNYTSSDANLQTCWYSLDEGTANATMVCGNNVSGLNSLEGTNIWNIWANDTAGNVNQSIVTFTKDTTFPVITVTSPAINYIHAQELGAMYVNFTTADSYFNYQWFSINGGTTNLSTTGNSTLANVTVGDATLHIWANDTSNNVGYAQRNFTVVNVSVGNVFTGNIVSTMPQTITSTINHSSSVSVASSFQYNQSYYTPLMSGKTYYYTLNAPQTNADVVINHTFMYNFSYRGYNLSINSTKNLQNVSAYSLSLCSPTIVQRTANYTTADQALLTRVNESTFKGTFNYYVNTMAYGNKTYSFDNYTDEGEWNFCIYPNYTTIYANLISEYSAGGYGKGGYVLSNYAFSNITQNITLYLLNTSGSTDLVVKILDSNLIPQKNIDVKLLRYYPGTNTWLEVQSDTTDELGQSIFHVIEKTVNYKFVLSSGGIIIYTTDIVKIVCYAVPCQIELTIPSPGEDLFKYYTNASGVSYALSYDNNTQIASIIFNSIDGTPKTIELLVNQVNISNKKIICDNYSTGTAGLIECNLSSYSGNFFAQAYVNTTKGMNILDRIAISTANFFKSTGTEGLFYAVMFIITLIFVGIWNPVVSIGLMMVGFTLLSITGIVAIPWFALISIVILGGYIIWNLKT